MKRKEDGGTGEGKKTRRWRTGIREEEKSGRLRKKRKRRWRNRRKRRREVWKIEGEEEEKMEEQ
jgi:hypothetical protein